MKSANGSESAGRNPSVGAILRLLMAEEAKLRSTTRQFYRSVTGPRLHSLHKLFEDQCGQLERWLEQLKARGDALNANVPRTSDAPSDESRVTSPPPFSGVPAARVVGALIIWHEQLAARLQEDTQLCARALADHSTAEILRQMAQFHETSAWILRTALEWRDSGI